MFTGIIEDVGRLDDCTAIDRGARLRICTKLAPELTLGQSVAINGVCLTVDKGNVDSIEVVAVPETLRKTNLGQLRRGSLVNLERALQVSARIDGHLVQGHVDARCPIVGRSVEHSDRLYTLECPDDSSHLVIKSGSIAIDGISLTIARQHKQQMTVAIVPYTYGNTNVRTWEVGTQRNVEFDMLGKYVARQLHITQAA